METEELDDLADVQSKVRSNFVSKFSLFKQHGGTLSALDSNTGLPPPTYSRQMSHRSSSLSSLSTDSGFPMSCGSPSPTTDVTCFEDIDRKLRRTSSTMTSPISQKTVTSYKSLPSPTRFISVFTPKCNSSSERSDIESSFSKFQKSKSLSMSNLATPKLVLHSQEFDSQSDVSKTSTVDNEQSSFHQNCSINPCSSAIEKERNASLPVSFTFRESRPAKHYADKTQADDIRSEKHSNRDHCSADNVCEKSRNSDMCDSAYPLKTSSPRVSRSSRPIGFPADFRKSFASSSHDVSDCSQPCSRDTMTAQLNAKNAVELNYGDYSDIDTVKVSAPAQHNPERFLKRSSCPDRAVTDSSIPGADHRNLKAERTGENHTGHREVRHTSIVNQPEFHTRLPFTISKFEDTSKTVRKRIPPGMVADMRQMFSAPIRRRQTMPVLSDIKKYRTLQTFDFPTVSNSGGISGASTSEMTLPGSFSETDEGKAENTERYCSGDSSPGGKGEVVAKNTNSDENGMKVGLQTSQKPDDFIKKCVVTNEPNNESDDNISDDSETVEFSPDLETSELNFYIKNGSILNEDDEESDNDTSDNVLEEYSDDSDDTVEECNIYASKDDVTFRVRQPDDPPSKLTTPSYTDNILRLSRNSLNYDDVESKENKTDNTSEYKKNDEEAMESVQRYGDTSFETKQFDESNGNVDDDNRPFHVPRRKVNMYSVINEFRDTDKQWRQSNMYTCIDLHTESREDDSTNTQTKGVDVQRNDRNLVHVDRTTGLHTEPVASTGETESKVKRRLKNDKKNEQIHQKGGIYCSRINVSPVAIGNKCTDGELSINNTPTRSHVTFDKPRADDKVTEACPTAGERDKPEEDHVALANNTSPQVESKQCRTPTVVDLSSVSSTSKPSDYNRDCSQGIDSMPERSAGPNNSYSEISEYSGGKKITTKTSTTDVNMNETSEEAKQTLAILTEAMSKLNGDNNDDILPEIKQSVAKLDGGNLVITTLTRKIIEEEEESGRGTPLPDYNDVFYVRDHKGNIYMVEDLTEDSQESAYYSSSNVSQENDYNRIHNLRSVGQTNIDHATAEEVLLGLYNQGRSGVQIEEIDENEKQLVVHKGSAAVDLNNQFSADSSFNRQSTKYEYDMANGGSQMPAQAGPRSTSKIKTIKQSYEMTSDGRNNKDGQPTEEDIKMETEETSTIKNMDSSGCKTMSSSFRYQTDASLLPPVAPETTVCVMPPPPMILPPVQPKLVQLDMTPVLPVSTVVPLVSMVPVTTTKVTERSSDRIVTSTEDNDAKMKLSEHGRPVYKSVALVKGPYETPKWQVTKTKTEKINEDTEDSKRYKLVRSHASNETQQRELSFQNSSSRFHEISGCVNRATVNENQNMYKSENVVHMNGGPVVEPKIHRTRIDVSSPPLPRMDYGDGGMCEYSESNKIITTQKLQSEPVFPARVPSPPRLSASSAEKDMMVVRGNILIKNTMDQGLEQFDDNINMFSKGFSMCKQNPLYQSDEDLQRRLLEEEERERRRQMDQEVAFETCDRYSKTKQVKRDQPQAGRQTLTSQLLMSKLSNIDVKDIRQHIDVQHHNEDIYGDARFMHADGSLAQAGANNFDSVNENIDLVMRGGKAYITITVTAERYTPIDKEFNVWRKSQAVVTRVIEIDFLANEQRRRLYMSVMERAGECEGEADRSAYGGGFGGQERVLSTKETLDLFSEIMDATEGEGDHEDITVKTKQHRTTLPPHDFLY
ncbi:uncharacterized protein LOC110466291 [Mizuhopecten yessoensis]|uniref:Uncharacterized protein n=1 Tax=Mizuhopecten yessoensis TaxID=6573 RepID=A0A210R211_MIZYE|nr:uncharacterized protein LOC110466291 [Mizuhopecten yessoensis]XP_021378383.1 uncharacterized protein LOC110466291 [Mizuhopecten yessoensis]OWF54935.1 hypothetical protein KP79_PYT00273 [Mizuhopecten yessoensis]